MFACGIYAKMRSNKRRKWDFKKLSTSYCIIYRLLCKYNAAHLLKDFKLNFSRQPAIFRFLQFAFGVTCITQQIAVQLGLSSWKNYEYVKLYTILIFTDLKKYSSWNRLILAPWSNMMKSIFLSKKVNTLFRVTFKKERLALIFWNKLFNTNV